MTDFCKTLPTLQRTWSASSLRLLMECPRKYWYRKIRGIRPVQSTVDLDFGAFLHIGMAAYDGFICRSMEHDEALIAALRVMLGAAGEKFITYTCTECSHQWRTEDHPVKLKCPKCGIDLFENLPDTEISWVPWNPDHNKKNRRTLVRALVWTLDEFAESHIRPHANPDGTAATEVDFAVPLPFNSPDGEPYLLAGIIDSFCEIGGPVGIGIGQVQVMPRERKTTNSTLGKGFFGRYEFDIQIDTYSLAMQIMAADEITPGVVLEGIQTAVGFSRARRQIITPSKDQLEEFVRTIGWWLRQAETFARDAQYYNYDRSLQMEQYPMNRANCNVYRKEDVEDKMYSSITHGGCPYRELCTKDRSVREAYEQGSYEMR